MSLQLRPCMQIKVVDGELWVNRTSPQINANTTTSFCCSLLVYQATKHPVDAIRMQFKHTYVFKDECWLTKPDRCKVDPTLVFYIVRRISKNILYITTDRGTLKWLLKHLLTLPATKQKDYVLTATAHVNNLDILQATNWFALDYSYNDLHLNGYPIYALGKITDSAKALHFLQHDYKLAIKVLSNSPRHSGQVAPTTTTNPLKRLIYTPASHTSDRSSDSSFGSLDYSKHMNVWDKEEPDTTSTSDDVDNAHVKEQPPWYSSCQALAKTYGKQFTLKRVNEYLQDMGQTPIHSSKSNACYLLKECKWI